MNASVIEQVDSVTVGEAEPQRARQRACRVPHFAGDLRDFPPSAEREEGRDAARPRGAAQAAARPAGARRTARSAARRRWRSRTRQPIKPQR